MRQTLQKIGISMAAQVIARIRKTLQYFERLCGSERRWPCIRLNDGPDIKLVDLFKLVGTGLSLVCCLVIRGSTGCFLLLRYFSGIVLHPGVLRVSQYVCVESSSLAHHRPYS